MASAWKLALLGAVACGCQVVLGIDGRDEYTAADASAGASGGMAGAGAVTGTGGAGAAGATGMGGSAASAGSGGSTDGGSGGSAGFGGSSGSGGGGGVTGGAAGVGGSAGSSGGSAGTSGAGGAQPGPLLSDDFEDGLLDGVLVNGAPTGSWVVDNVDDTSWVETAGVMSTTANSCVSWTAPECDPKQIGPALIHAEPPFDVQDGRFTIDLDVYSRQETTGNWKLWFALRQDAPSVWNKTSHLADPAYMAVLVFEPPVFYEMHAFGSRLNQYTGADIRVAEWHHFHVAICGTEGYFIELSRGGQLIARESTLADMTPAPATTKIYLELMGEGIDKRFDNLVVRRGCL